MAKAPTVEKKALEKFQALPLDRQVDLYTTRLAAIMGDAKIQEALKELALLEEVKSGWSAIVAKDPKLAKLPDDEGITIETRTAILKFTKKPESQALVFSVSETIKKLGLDECLPAISLSASKLRENIGVTASKKYIKTTTAERRFQSLTVKS